MNVVTMVSELTISVVQKKLITDNLNNNTEKNPSTTINDVNNTKFPNIHAKFLLEVATKWKATLNIS